MKLTQQDSVLDKLTESGELDMNELSKLTKLSPGHTSAVICNLKKHGLVEEQVIVIYTPTTLGKKRVQWIKAEPK